MYRAARAKATIEVLPHPRGAAIATFCFMGSSTRSKILPCTCGANGKVKRSGKKVFASTSVEDAQDERIWVS